MEWQVAMRGYLTYLAASGASAATIRLRRHYIVAFARTTTAPFNVDALDLTSFLATSGWAPETRKSARASLRAFYGWALTCGHINVNPATSLPTVTVPPGQPRPAPDDVFSLALARADARGRLLLMLGAYCGLRRAEIAQVHTRDLVAGSLRVTGKGGRTRIVPVHPSLLGILEDADPGYLFPGLTNGHLSPKRVGEIIADLLGSGWTAHTLRHRFASRAYAVDRDLRAVQELLGHSTPDTTARYTAIPDGALRAAVAGVA